MFKFIVNWFLILSLLPGSMAYGVDINGQLKNAQLEKSASDPVTNVVDARLYYNTTSKKPKIYNGTAWSDLGGSSGSGEKNYISANPSGATDTTGWACVGDLDIARTATVGDLPREVTTATGLKITADANTQSTADYCYYDFTLDDIDTAKKLKIEWAQKQTGSYVASDLAVVITTQADRTTALFTPSPTTNIPAADYSFQTTFDTSTTLTLSLVVRATTDMATDAGIVISDVIVGPGTIVQGAAVGPISPVVTFSNTTGATISSSNMRFARHGEFLIITGYLTITGTGSDAGAFSFALTGLTPVTASGSVVSVGLATTNVERMYLLYASGGSFLLYSENTGSAAVSIKGTDLGNSTSGDIQTIYFNNVGMRINEWIGNGIVNLAANGIEYASSTTGTWDAAAAATDTRYGPAGSPVGAALTADRTKLVRFQTAIQPTDAVWVELQILGNWVPATIFPYIRQNSTYYGVQLSGVTGNDTDVSVFFGRYTEGSGTTYASAGGAWSASVENWRVVKAKSGQTVGFGAATSSASGLVSRENNVAEGDLGTITKGGTWATIDSAKYKCIQVGKRVDVWARLESTTASSGLTSLTWDLPSACPTPGYFSTNATSEWASAASGFISTGLGTAPVATTAIVYRHPSVGYQMNLYMASGAYKIAAFHSEYWVD